MEKRQGLLAGIALAGGASAAAVCLSQKQRRDAYATDGRGQTVLITGASGGIGRELAFVFAEHHFNVVAVARNAKKLKELKKELDCSCHVNVHAIAKDLSDGNAAREIFDEVQAAGIEVTPLVNNAGAGKQSCVVDADPDAMRDLIHLNVTSLTLISHYFGQRMAKRGYGRIMNVSSMGALIPDSHFNVYGPTKTGWAINAGKADAKIAKDPGKVAREGFLGMQQGQLVIIPDADCRTFRLLMRPLPAGFQAHAIAQWQRRLIAQS